MKNFCRDLSSIFMAGVMDKKCLIRCAISTVYFVVVAIVITGCASGQLPTPDKEHVFKHDDLIKQASYAAYVQHDVAKAISLINSADDALTDGGKLSGGKGFLYLYEAADVATRGHYEFWQGDIGLAAKDWRTAFTIRYTGAMNAQKAAEEAQRDAALVGTLFVAAIGSYGMRKAKTTEQANKIYNLTQTNIKAIDNLPPVSIQPDVRASGIPINHVIRVPVTVEEPPFENILRLRNPNGSCTSTLLARNVALTNAHCVTHYANGAPDWTEAYPYSPSSIKLVRERIINNEPYNVERFYTHQGENKGWNGEPLNDWAILVLSTSDTATYPDYPLVFPRAPINVRKGNIPLMMAGYSGDLNHGAFLTLHYNCRVGRVDRSRLVTNCDSYKGSSGASVLTREPPYRVVSLNHASYNSETSEYRHLSIPTEFFYPKLLSVFQRYSPERYAVYIEMVKNQHGQR